ncbi:peptidoglycan-binding domain-containing protein [Kiloniella antarctica]|uniref:Peptidoglycan-binding protein n=1 Tax=Kiloniella antarctica TaxID=1550907 RepID=A0ABW5BE04_9PROT
MSDNKLKSEDTKPANGKTAEKKTPAVPKSKTEKTKTSPAQSKTSATNPKTKKAKASTGKAPKAKTPASQVSGKKSSKVTKAVKPNDKKADSPEPLVATNDPKVDSKNKGKKTSPPLSAKPENGPAPKLSKKKSFSRMITVAAVLFLGVLFVFLRGNDPVSEEDQTASNLPATQAEAPNPNASSPYGMRVEQLKEIETLLARLNLDPGSIDGDIDHESVAAISLFQEISGLQVDGRPSPDLLVDLKAVEQLLKVE